MRPGQWAERELIGAGRGEFPPLTLTLVPDQWPIAAFTNDWGYKTTAQEGLLGRAVPMQHGRLVGGSSSVNGMLWTRGDPTDVHRTTSLQPSEGPAAACRGELRRPSPSISGGRAANSRWAPD